MSERFIFKSGLHGQEFDKINKFDFRVCDFQGVGSYFTVLPISPVEYRKAHKTEARVELGYNKKYVIFYIYDDWGEKHELHIPKQYSAQIEAYKQLAFDLNLAPNNAPTSQRTSV